MKICLILLLFVSQLAFSKEIDENSVFKLGLRESISTLDPFSRSSGIEAWWVRKRVLEFLLYFDESTGKIKPGLAQKYTFSKDRKILSFYLRKNVKFHDGSPFSSKDVLFSYELLFDDKYDMATWRPLFTNIKNVEIVNDHLVKFHLKEPLFETFENIVRLFRIVPQAKYDKPKDKSWNQSLLGTGPFVVKKFKAGRSVEFIKNKDWWGQGEKSFDPIHFGRIQMPMYESFNLAVKKIKRNQLDYYPLKGFVEVKSVTKDSDFNKKIFLIKNNRPGRETKFSISLNLKNLLFVDRRLRRALNQLWDRKGLAQRMFKGEIEPDASLWPLTGSYKYRAQSIEYSKVTAMRELELLGWADKDKNGVLEKEVNGKKNEFKFTILFSSNSIEPLLTDYQQAAKKVGIHVKLKKVDSSLVWDILHEKKFDAYASEDFVVSRIIPSTIATNGFYNEMNYSNKVVDRTLEALKYEFDPAQRLKLERKIVQRMDQDVPVIYGFRYPYEYSAVSKRVDLNAVNPKGVLYWSFLKK